MFHESTSDSMLARFGAPNSAEIPNDLAPFLTHRSVRDYTSEPIDKGIIRGLIAAAQSASTSSNLQLWTAISIQDPEKRTRIWELTGKQRQVENAAWFFGFFADHARIKRALARVNEVGQGLDFTEFSIMAMIDASIAAERMICAAEALGIGCCYIGALRNRPDEVATLLKLPKGVVGLFGLCLGWPDESKPAEIKPRLLSSAVWHQEEYLPDLDAELDDYDQRMTPFYESQGMKGEVTWSMRSGKRLNGSPESMSGREVLKDVLLRNGFGKR